MPRYVNPGAAAVSGLLDFLAQREAEKRQAMLDALEQQDRARRMSREDTATSRQDLLFKQGQEDREREIATAAKATKRGETVDQLSAMRQASVNASGSGDPTGAQATRNAIAVAMRSAGAGEQADEGVQADAAASTARARSAAIADYAAEPTPQKAAVLKLAYNIEPPKKDKPERDPVADALAIAEGKARIDQRYAKPDTKAAEKTEKEAAAKQAQADVASEALSLIDALESHAGEAAATGAYELRRGRTQDAINYETQFNQLRSLLTRDAIKSMRGMGALSDKDLEMLQRSVTSLDLRQDPNAIRGELTRLREGLRRGLEGGGSKAKDTRKDLGAGW